MDQSEKILLIAVAGYARKHSVSLAKISWALSSIMQKPENNIYHKLRDIDLDLDDQLTKIYDVEELSDEVGDSIGLDEEDIIDDLLESKVGDIVTVEVLSVKTFGAVCRVEDTTRTLLLHLSEIANDFITDVRDYVKEGQKLKAMLITNQKGQLGLSTRKINSVSDTKLRRGDDQ
jgi:polyribonucleotide nucleotidyltransferase